MHAESLTLLMFGFQSVVISDEVTAPSSLTEPECHNQCNDERVRGMISTISLDPYSDFMSGNIALGRRGPRHEPIKLSSQSDPVIRPSHEEVPHALGI